MQPKAAALRRSKKKDAHRAAIFLTANADRRAVSFTLAY